MIRSFKSKDLAALFATGQSAKIDGRMHKRIMARLDALDAATAPAQLNLPGFNYHSLRGFVPVRFTIHVNGPWCITFEFDDQDAANVDFEQYH